MENPEFEHMGQYLRKLRTDKGLTIKEVANTTRISEINLNAIENQDFSTLPADTFTRGFLGIYARLLGIDPKEIVNPFMQERETKKSGGKKPKTKQPRKILAPKILAEPSHFSSMTAAIILLIIIVFLFTAFCLYTSWNPFSFLTEKENSFQSIMMSVVPETGPGMEQPHFDSRAENAENLSGETVNEGDETTPETEDRNSPQPAPRGSIDNKVPATGSAPVSLIPSREDAFAAEITDDPRPGMGKTTAVSIPEDLPRPRG